MVCPDCGAKPVNRQFTHQATCPIGLAVDAMMAADREWFEQHPGADHYYRSVTNAEVAEFSILGERPVGKVLVHQVEPGLRMRQIETVPR